MDFSNFRDSGELSDLTVVVDGKEFKLHKFPLYIKSDFFRALARNPPKDQLALTDFPGGADTFEMVANYCYNVKISITKDNVCSLRCAAEYLQMTNRANVSDLADRFLQDILTSAKLGKHIGCIIELVQQCCSLGPIAEQAGIVDRCIAAIVDCWLLSTKFTKRLPSDKMATALTDSEVFERLSRFPLSWFVALFGKARDKSVRPQLLASMIQAYINRAVSRVKGEEHVETEEENIETETGKEESIEEEIVEETADLQESLNQDDDSKASDKKEGSENEDKESNAEEEQSQSEEIVKDDDKSKEEENDEETEETNIQNGEQEDKTSDPSIDGTPVDPENANEEGEEEAQEEEPEENVDDDVESEDSEVPDLKEVLDKIVPELPDNPVLADLLEPHWAIMVLNLAEELGCDCCSQLRRLVGRMLHRFSPKELSDMPPQLLTEIVQEACKDPQPGQHGVVCGVIDNYLRELSQKGELSVDTFTTMVEAVPQDYRMSHDTLFQVLEALLQSDKVKLTDEQKTALMNTVDFRRLSESTLQRAYDSDLVPQTYITKAALALCSRLRTELESARSVIKSQEAELSRYGIGGRTPAYSSHYSRQVESTPPAPATVHVISNPSKLKYEAPGITYTYPSGAMSNLSSDLELQLALDSLDTRQDSVAASSTYDSYSSPTYTGSTYSYDDPHDTYVSRKSYGSRSLYDRTYPTYRY